MLYYSLPEGRGFHHSGFSRMAWQGICVSVMIMSLGGANLMKKKKRKKKSASVLNGIIDFDFGSVSYQIDTTRRKVYHRWIEVETAKTFLIMGAFNQTQVHGKAL